jgi:hypothetical protein
VNNGSNGIAELEAIFADRPDLIFRHFEDCAVPMMRWQAGREVADVVARPDGYGLLIERFELLAWASTGEQLIDKLTAC